MGVFWTCLVIFVVTAFVVWRMELARIYHTKPKPKHYHPTERKISGPAHHEL